jgi:hypothetical protein
MRQPFFLSWPSVDGSLFFGGGPDPVAPPAPEPTPATPAPETEEAKRKSTLAAKRRLGGVDALKGNVLGSMATQQTMGKSPTLGGSGGGYTGEA